MNGLHILAAVLGLALLMVVHESGHLIVARLFGMRVIKFSIGFGPTLWKHKPKGSDTTYQIGLIPFLAYVQIAGMNPFEEVDKEDKGSYANASLFGRISAIFAGPLANYLFASVLFFAAFLVGGEQVPTLQVKVMDDGAAKAAKMHDDDIIVAINGKQLNDFEELRDIVIKSPNKELKFKVMRNGKPVELAITPRPKAAGGGGLIGVEPIPKTVPVNVKDAAAKSVVLPPVVVRDMVVGFGSAMWRMVTLQEKPQLVGPVGIGKEIAKAAKTGWESYLSLLAILSAYLGGFNLVPFPALDGGRLMFLSYEAVTRRRPNMKVEAYIHAVGLVMLLALIAVVTIGGN